MAVENVQRTRKFWGWGYEGEGLAEQEIEAIGDDMLARFDVQPQAIAAPPPLDSLSLPDVRLAPPPALAAMCSQEARERAVHTLGKSYDDLVRGIRGDYRHAPDIVAYPRDEQDVERILAWCAEAQRRGDSVWRRLLGGARHRAGRR